MRTLPSPLGAPPTQRTGERADFRSQADQFTFSPNPLRRLWGAKTPSVSGRAASGKPGPPNAGRGEQTLCLESRWWDGWGLRIRCLCRSLRAVPTQGPSPTDTGRVSAHSPPPDADASRWNSFPVAESSPCTRAFHDARFAACCNSAFAIPGEIWS